MQLFLLAAVMAAECPGFVIFLLRAAIVINFSVSSHLSGNTPCMSTEKKGYSTETKQSSLMAVRIMGPSF